MRILHTADWHLGDRLGRIDRTHDLRRAVERVGAYCATESVDVLLVAGDLFSELARPDGLRETIEHWQTVFRGFLAGGGTVLTITGNHDNENFCRTLVHAMNLAAPLAGVVGERLPPSRLYLATEPTLIKLRDKAGFDVQFVLMPYPTPTRYLRDDPSPKFAGPSDKAGKLSKAFVAALDALRADAAYDRDAPTVLAAHVTIRGQASAPILFRIAEPEDIVIPVDAVSDGFAYVALGHIHKPGSPAGLPHIRYSGSIEKMDLGEAGDHKGVVVFDIDAKGLAGEPRFLPLPSTAIYEIDIHTPAADLPELRQRFPDAANDLVNVNIRYTAGVDRLEDVLGEVEEIFPRYYSRDFKESSAVAGTLTGPSTSSRGKGFPDTVREYVTGEIAHHTEEEQADLLARLETLLIEHDKGER